MSTIIGHGAEAILYREGDRVLKERVSKSYRHPTLDSELRKLRTRAESRILERLLIAGVRVPKVTTSDDSTMQLTMEFLDGPKVRDVLDSDPAHFGEKIGALIGTMHNANVAHQDLTTSNMIFVNKEIALIDFGLSFVSTKEEDKAVDLHLLERALAAKHSTVYDAAWDAVVKGYEKTGKEATSVLKRYEDVKKRGRNKVQY